MAKIARGYKIQLSKDNVSFTTIQNVLDLQLPTVSRDSIETTSHTNSAGAERQSTKLFSGGLVEPGQIVFTSNHPFYFLGEGYNNWNGHVPPMVKNTRSSGVEKALHDDKDLKSALVYEEIDINGNGDNTHNHANHGIRRTDTENLANAAFAGTGWTTDDPSTNNTAIVWDGDFNPRRLIVNTGNTPYYVEKIYRKDQSDAVDVVQGLRHKLQFDYEIHNFTGSAPLIMNYARSGHTYSSPYSGFRGHRIPVTVGTHNHSWLSGGYKKLSMFTSNSTFSMSGLKLYRLYSFFDLITLDTNLYGKILAPDGSTESTFRACVYNEEKSAGIDATQEVTISLQLKELQTYV